MKGKNEKDCDYRSRTGGSYCRCGNFAEKFHGKIFRDNEIAFVYIYQQPVDIETLVLQKEEVESVRWFDLEETYRNCRNRNTQFCAPVPGLEVVRQYLYS